MQRYKVRRRMSGGSAGLLRSQPLRRILVVWGLVTAFSGSAFGVQTLVSCTSDAECNDGLYCTIDQCLYAGLPISRCINAPGHTERCADANYCDGIEWCDAKRCIGGTKPNGLCGNDTDCPGGKCGPKCAGGTNDGQYCGKQADCPGGVCQGLGTGNCYECAYSGVPCDPIQCPTGQFCAETYDRCVECEVAGDCDDSNNCNGVETCNLADFTCHIGTPKDCSSLTDDCNTGVCNAATGQCEHNPVQDGVPCDDNNLCTVVDECQDGVCVGGRNPNGCVRLELRVPLSQQEINVGDILKLSLFAVADGCSGGKALLAGIEAAISWDPEVLKLASAAEIGEANPQDPCDNPDSCYYCGTIYRYNWAASAFPNDCNSGDGLNSPCYPQFPANDGDAYYANMAYIGAQCICHGGRRDGYACGQPPNCPDGTCGAQRAWATAGGLHVTTLKFKALASSGGQPTYVTLEDCIGQTRTLVASGAQQGDILKEISAASPVVVKGCEAPTAAAEGCRYIAVTPPAEADSVAFFVTGVNPPPPGDPDVSCVGAYVQADGKLGPTPVYRTPAQWGTVHVRGADLRPDGSYRVHADCGAANPGAELSDPITSKTWKWGETNMDGTLDFVDITRVVDGFRGVWHNLGRPCTSDTQCTMVTPHKKCDREVGFCLAITMEDVDMYGGTGCAPDRVVDFVDITRDVDAFIGKPYPCPPCP